MTSVSSLRVAHVALWGLASDRVAADNELSLITGDSTLRSFASHLKTRGREVSNYCIAGKKKSRSFLSIRTDAESEATLTGSDNKERLRSERWRQRKVSDG